tara:strand:+ start:1404 stop:1646 length:243 start_codon:yes stop_codon:yes gene_type:complete
MDRGNLYKMGVSLVDYFNHKNPKNSHAMHPHLQIELSESRIIHIQYPRTSEQSKNFFIINESGKYKRVINLSGNLIGKNG